MSDRGYYMTPRTKEELRELKRKIRRKEKTLGVFMSDSSSSDESHSLSEDSKSGSGLIKKGTVPP